MRAILFDLDGVLYVGERLIDGAPEAMRLKAALVRSGKFRPADLERGVTPDVILDSIRSLPEWWSQAK